MPRTKSVPTPKSASATNNGHQVRARTTRRALVNEDSDQKWMSPHRIGEIACGPKETVITRLSCGFKAGATRHARAKAEVVDGDLGLPAQAHPRERVAITPARPIRAHPTRGLLADG